MRLPAKVALLSCGLIAAAGALLFAGACLSTPRDFASPAGTIRVVDQSGVPVAGLDVRRNWYDRDTEKDGCDRAVPNQSGAYTFSKVPAQVGLFTGAWRRACSRLMRCEVGGGAWTMAYVRFPGHYDVLPQGKPLHAVGPLQHDPDGVQFASARDRQSNTLVALTFPAKTRSIDYVLTSKPHGE